jgi:hypothetical protein
MEVMITSTTLDKDYENSHLMFSAGDQNPGEGHIGAIASPIPVTNSTLEASPLLPDPAFFSYPYSGENQAAVWGILAKITSKGGTIPSTCTLRLFQVPTPADDQWTDLTGANNPDVVLKRPPSPRPEPLPCPTPADPDLLTDPQGFACVGGTLFGIDYESQLLTILEGNELSNKSGSQFPTHDPYDLSSFLDVLDARGQAIIALGNTLYPLYICTDVAATQFAPSIIARFDVAGTALSNGVQAVVGKNAQEIIPVIDALDAIQLLIPAIGGRQNVGNTNGIDSNISLLPAADSWSTVNVILTGDPNKAALATAYDIHDLAALCRNKDSLVFILTTMFDTTYSHLFFRIYKATVNGLLVDLPNVDRPDPDEPPTISEAVAGNVLTVVDEGMLTSPTPAADQPSGIYHPSIAMIQDPEDPEKDLLVFTTGAWTLITRAMAYGSPTAIYPYNTNPYAIFANAWGVNANSYDITKETRNQAEREVSLKRGGRLTNISPTAATGAEEGDEDNK